MLNLADFSEIWLIDFEFNAPAGEPPDVVCLVALEFKTGKVIKLWKDELMSLSKAPFPVDKKSLVVAYYASAEIGCFISLGWEWPARILDLYTEIRTLTNGLKITSGTSLIGALIYYNLDHVNVIEKDDMRNLILSGGPWSDREKLAILNYCESDVKALGKLLPQMEPEITEHALLRGQYMGAVAAVETNGIPIDVETLALIQKHGDKLKREIASEEATYGIYLDSKFSYKRFENFLIKKNYTWPTENGRIILDKDTFKDMANFYPEIEKLHEIRTTLSQLRLMDLKIGSDGRNRCLLSAFRSKTGRNQPSNSAFIFGPSRWIRSLIKPEPGTALCYCDWSQQEFGISAALSRDEKMMRAYNSGDPYLEFAKLAKAIPKDATKKSHPREREQYKATLLAVNYSMGARSLAYRLNSTPAHAKELLRMHREAFPKFWVWVEAAVDHGLLNGQIQTCLGWPLHVDADSNTRSIQNFPMQANGAEMLRIACVLGIERGLKICALVHDAILIEAPIECIEDDVKLLQETMAEASEIILNGFRLRSEPYIIKHPDRFIDERGIELWDEVMKLLSKFEDEIND